MPLTGWLCSGWGGVRPAEGMSPGGMTFRSSPVVLAEPRTLMAQEMENHAHAYSFTQTGMRTAELRNTGRKVRSESLRATFACLLFEVIFKDARKVGNCPPFF